MWDIVKTVFCWATTMLCALVALGAFLDHQPIPAIFAIVMGLLAYPPLWRYPGFRLTRVPAHVRWTLAILIFVGFGLSVKTPNAAQPSAQTHPAK